MLRKTMAIGLLMSLVAIAACNTARGAKADVNSASDAVANATDGKN